MSKKYEKGSPKNIKSKFEKRKKNIFIAQFNFVGKKISENNYFVKCFVYFILTAMDERSHPFLIIILEKRV